MPGAVATAPNPGDGDEGDDDEDEGDDKPPPVPTAAAAVEGCICMGCMGCMLTRMLLVALEEEEQGNMRLAEGDDTARRATGDAMSACDGVCA